MLKGNEISLIYVDSVAIIKSEINLQNFKFDKQSYVY